jgi:pimeloyl-ACP methyl ester carboxylesterase
MATYVLIAGTAQGGWCWQRVTPLLRAAGHTVYTPSLTGLADRSHLLSPDVGLETHIADVLNLLEWDDLHEVVLVGHSYGGMVITGVADRMPERLSHVVYLDAVWPSDGQGVFAGRGGDYAQGLRAIVDAEGEGWYLPKGARSAVDWGVTNPSDMAWVDAKSTAHPWRTLVEPLRLRNTEPDGLPRSFIRCTLHDMGDWVWDDGMTRRVDQVKAAGRYHEIESGHDAMITAPGKLAELLAAVA